MFQWLSRLGLLRLWQEVLWMHTGKGIQADFTNSLEQRPCGRAESKEHEAGLIPTVQRLLVPAALSGGAKSLVFGKVFLRLAKMDKQLAWH